MAPEVILERVVNCLVFHEATHSRHNSHQLVGAGALSEFFFPLFICSVSIPSLTLQLSVTAVKHNVIPFCFLSCPAGSLIQLPSVERGKLSKVRLGSLSLKKEGERQCFLFTKHFLVCTRSSGGKLHLLKVSVSSP